ncbi:MAG: hypothetical protein ACYTGB_13105 [Planctomycetota bacterium]
MIKQQVRSGKPSQKATFHRRISGWTVIYTAAHLDITEKIIKELNTRYERGLDSEKG